MEYDPIEDTPEYLAIKNELEAKLAIKANKYLGIRGGCHLYWVYKKRILKEDYDIDWKSPAELNPHTMYD